MRKKWFLPLLTALILVFLALVGLAPRIGLSNDQPPTLSAHQEIQRQVNQSLLRATVLMATYAGQRYENGFIESTPTAIMQEMIDNYATIEALRPTADAEHIILVQKPVQPALESEATLFAEAYTVSAPFEVQLGTPTGAPTSELTDYPTLRPTATAYILRSTPQISGSYPYPSADQPSPYP